MEKQDKWKIENGKWKIQVNFPYGKFSIRVIQGVMLFIKALPLIPPRKL